MNIIMDNNIIICPHCKDYIIITKINCGIFRHGIFKQTGKQIHPHLDKITCEQLFDNNMIYGCGKPFKIITNNGVLVSIVCDYI